MSHARRTWRWREPASAAAARMVGSPGLEPENSIKILYYLIFF
jgi:hypothetical protein